MSSSSSRDLRRGQPWVNWPAQQGSTRLFIPKPTTDEELLFSVYLLTGTQLPNVAVCDHHVSPFQAFADSYFGRSPVVVWKASRGFGGKSTLLATLGFMYQVMLGAYVTIVGGSLQQAQRVQAALNAIWTSDRAPSGLLTTDPSKYYTRTANGGFVEALAASQRSVRGPHPQKLLCDEIDEMDQGVLDAAFGMPMAAPGIDSQIVLSSTHHHATGTMSEMLSRAGQNHWPVYEWCYRETSYPGAGWLPDSEIALRRQTVTSYMWQVEYDLQEPSSEGRAIETNSIDATFDITNGEYEGTPGEVVVWKERHVLGTYATGADWAKKRNFTDIVTIRTDVRPMELVCFQRCQQGLPWPAYVAAFNDQVKLYGSIACHDATGIGQVVDSYLEVDADGVELVGKRRSELLSSYIAWVESGGLVGPRIRSIWSEHRYATTNDIFGSGHLPDSICAAALAKWAHETIPYREERTVRVSGKPSVLSAMQSQYGSVGGPRRWR